MTYRELAIFAIPVLVSVSCTPSSTAPFPRCEIAISNGPDGGAEDKTQEWRQHLGRGAFSLAQIVTTPRGNGTLYIDNVEVRVIDQYDDAYYYQDGKLNVVFDDIDGDGYGDLVVKGIACVTDEKSGVIQTRHAVVGIFLCAPAHRQFVATHLAGFAPGTVVVDGGK